ncbi:XrtA/PEP-CTERM system histidine kinase PrsK [Rheinheimera maricola]|uniref:histidine kinase n=2 Tax=Rheinheimera maricola TaxID=2793282 RepID=A0ABS7X4U9_9GAMM|nr:XrtA/PEP-CTERM system histidine kinase PrsK [Rheinheimera maricola]MBZ9610564.1 PEP-CTERM system histidine kinase PrsK [Rheinheimera maricola]
MDFLTELAVDKIGFGLACIANLFFFLLTLATRVKNLPKSLLLSWSLLNTIWAGYYIFTAVAPYSSTLSISLELGRNLLLLLFLLSALGNAQQTLWQLLQKGSVQLLIVVMSGWTALCVFQLLSTNLIFTGSLAICILQLSLLEAIYRRAAAERWQYKPLVLGITVCALFDFVLLAESAMFGQVDNQLWSARGFVYAGIIPLLIISVRRVQAWGINVYVSRDIVLQSSLVLAAGCYLCLIAVAGFYIRYIGGNWSNLLQTAFWVLGFAMLAILLLSGAVRRRLKVFIEKHFFANKFDYRQKWLELTRQLKLIDLSKTEQYQTVLYAWLNAIGYQRGCLIQLDEQKNFNQLAIIGRGKLNPDELVLLKHYVQQFEAKHWIVDLSDNKDPFSQQHQLNNIDIQLIVPIYSDTLLWGLCLMNAPDVDRQHLNWELRDYLMLVSEQISSYLLLMQTSEQLSENAQFVAFSRMSAFIVHDLKNVKAQIDLLLTNSIKHRRNPEFIDDSFETLAAMQKRLENMLSQLSNKQIAAANNSVFTAAAVVTEVVTQRCASKSPTPVLNISNDGQLSVDKERFASVLFHLIDNAQHATADTGTIKIDITTDEHNLIVQINDSGCGMSEEFIQQRLFKPFDSTKGNAGMGIGAYDALHFAKQHEGQLMVSSKEGIGTTFTLVLPLH